MTTARERIRTIGILCIILAGIALLHALSAANTGTPAQALAVECSDGIDNDGDGDVDFPDDTNCDSPDDNFEGPTQSGIRLTLTDGKETAAPGDNLTYSILLSTTGLDPQVVDVRFTMPEYVTLISASDLGFVQGTFIHWPQVTVFPQNPRKLSINVHVNPTAKDGDALSARVAAIGTEATDTTTIAEETVPASNWTTISVTDGKTVTAPEEILTYRIVVTNRETIKRDITVRAQVPTTFVLHEVTGNHRKSSQSIVWDSLEFGPKETREFFVTGHVDRNVADNYALTFSVSTGKYVVKDTTTIRRQGKDVIDALRISLNDDQQIATNGQILEYEVRLENPTNKLVTNLEVNAGLPNYTEFVDAMEGGEWTGSSVFWKGLTVSPFGSRILHFAVRVRSDAPLGAAIRAGAVAMGQEAYDVTEVGTTRIGMRNVQAPSKALPFQKRADSSEVRPGGTVGFTITLKNTTSHPMRNITIQDKFDAQALRMLESTKNTTDVRNGIATWNIAELQPGQSWSVQYRMQVNPSVAHGVRLTNVATVSGEGLEELSLTERVQTVHIGVLTKLPKSGASLDLLFLLFTGIFGAGQVAAMQLKREALLM
ncbi:MAG: hypothetical protein PHU04_02710 [Candidatus Peribacteraceae bacterium]|nr:hypothetical protein [Candidatus Peribacteraceae bacterium]